MTARTFQKGFTLIELLIVIAVLGVLAAVVLVAVNPIEQLARGRDSGRKTTVGQLGKAVQAYYTSHSTSTPPIPAQANWITTLQQAGEVKQVPAPVTYSVTGTAACGTGAQNGYCYYFTGTEYVVLARMESGSEDSKCPGANAWFVYSSTDGQAGTVCSANQPTALTFASYL